MKDVDNSLLGKNVGYEQPFKADVLLPLDRNQQRESLGISSPLPFHGEDLWTAYELSWLDSGGKPKVAIVSFRFPANSPQMIESKSFKLYLNGFNQKHFDDAETVRNLLIKDLSTASESDVAVDFIAEQPPSFTSDAICIDELPISDFEYQTNPALLKCKTGEAGDQKNRVEEYLYSDLLRSNCPVTGQPDWASVYFRYKGNEIDRESLLRYVVSYRQHQGFHENCVEQMFVDILDKCQCESLSVYARYTRRGGLDINPYRATFDYPAEAAMIRTERQ